MSFRETARQWFIYVKAVGALDLDFEDCPAVCAKDEQTKPGSFCDECDVKECRDNFKAFTEDALEANSNTRGVWQQYGFDSLKRAVEEISDLQNIPRGTRRIKTHRLIQEFIAVKNRFRRIDEDNQKPAE